MSDDSKNELALMSRLRQIAPILLVMMEDDQRLDKYINQGQISEKKKFLEEYNEIDKLVGDDFNESTRGENLQNLFQDLTKSRKNTKKLFNKYLFHKSKVRDYQQELKNNRFSYEGLNTLFSEDNVKLLLEIQKGYFAHLENVQDKFDTLKEKNNIYQEITSETAGKPKRAMPEAAKKPSLIDKFQIMAPTLLKRLSMDSDYTKFMKEWLLKHPHYEANIQNFMIVMNQLSSQINLFKVLNNNQYEELKKILYKEPQYRQFSTLGKKINMHVQAFLALHNDYTKFLANQQNIKPGEIEFDVTPKNLLVYQAYVKDLKKLYSGGTSLKLYALETERPLDFQMSSQQKRYKSEIKVILGLLNKSGLGESDKIALLRQYLSEMKKELSQEKSSAKGDSPFIWSVIIEARIKAIDAEYKNTKLPIIANVNSSQDMFNQIKNQLIPQNLPSGPRKNKGLDMA